MSGRVMCGCHECHPEFEHGEPGPGDVHYFSMSDHEFERMRREDAARRFRRENESVFVKVSRAVGWGLFFSAILCVVVGVVGFALFVVGCLVFVAFKTHPEMSGAFCFLWLVVTCYLYVDERRSGVL